MKALAGDEDTFMKELLEGIDDNTLASSQSTPPLRPSQKANALPKHSSFPLTKSRNTYPNYSALPSGDKGPVHHAKLSQHAQVAARKRKAEGDVKQLLDGLNDDAFLDSAPERKRSPEQRPSQYVHAPVQAGKIARAESSTANTTPKGAHRPMTSFMSKPTLSLGTGGRSQTSPSYCRKPEEIYSRRSASHVEGNQATSVEEATTANQPPRKVWEAKMSPAGKGEVKAYHGWPLLDMSQEAVAHRQESRLKARAYLRATVKHAFDKMDAIDGALGHSGKERLLVIKCSPDDSPVRLSSLPPGLSHSSSSSSLTPPGETRVVHLRDEWSETDIREGDIINLIGSWTETTQSIYGDLLSMDGTGTAAAPTVTRPTHLNVELEHQTSDPADMEDDDLWDGFGSQDLPSTSQISAVASNKTPGAAQSSAQSRTILTMIISSSPTDIHNLLIHHPDLLVPVTKVADGASCSRRSVIQDKLRATGELSRGMLFGNMLHEVLQACLTGEDEMRQEGKLSTLPSRTSATSATSAEWEEMMAHPLVGWPETWPYLGDFSATFVKERVKEQVKVNLENLFALDINTSDAYVDLINSVKPFAAFGQTYLSTRKSYPVAPFTENINPEATLVDSRSAGNVTLRIHRVLDVEEDIWSPMYGLKGKVDVSAEVEIYEPDLDKPLRSVSANGFFVRGRQQQLNPAYRSNSHSGCATSSAKMPIGKTLMVVPLEIKTGKAVQALEHRAQTMLYTLLMSDRYGTNIDAGLLYYSKTSTLHRVRRALHEIRSLLRSRNEIANYLSRSSKVGQSDPTHPITAPHQAELLPSPIDEVRRCARCFAADGCTLYRRAHALPPPEEPEIEELLEKKTGHLKESDYSFFRTWDKLVTLEEGDLVKHRRELWTMTAGAREEAGKCFANMRLLPESIGKVTANIKGVNKYSYVFGKASSSRASSPLMSGHLNSNDPVTISIEPSLLSLAQGFITTLTPDTVTVGMDHSLDAALQRAVEEGLGDGASVRFRIDRDELFAGVGKIRMNIAKLLFSGTDADERRRQVIVDLSAPVFGADDLPNDLPESLNTDQRAAVGKVLAAEDYALILGMPGSGKTTTIAELIKMLVKRGKTILLTSYTHSAVDTIMRKLLEAPETRLLRLGNASKTHPDLQPYTSDAIGAVGTVAMLETSLMGANVVGTTCLSLGHVIFSRRRFDYCVVDEASQVTLPTCLGPLRFADKFILVGDHFQLPPLVRNPAARDGGLEVSLFKRLSDAHPSAVASLTAQYRMNADIMALSNKLIYSGRLRCGSEEVANQVLELPTFGRAMALLHGAGQGHPLGGNAASSSSETEASVGSSECPGGASCWLASALDPQRKACFLDTDLLGASARESRQGDLVQNVSEASILASIVEGLLLSGVKAKDIVIITPYRQQIKLLAQALLRLAQAQLTAAAVDVEILTADRAQGRDKAVGLVSLVRSNAESSVGRLLGDWRRINVAFTRAQKKLLIIGSQNTLGAMPIFRDFFQLVNERGWVYALPRGAGEERDHVLRSGTQGQGKGPVERKLVLC